MTSRAKGKAPSGEIRNVAVLGAGKIGQTLIRALLDTKMLRPTELVATTRHRETIETVGRALGVRTTLDNRAACREAEIVIVAVKPQQVEEVCKDVRGSLGEKHLVISTVASVPTAFLEERLGHSVPVIRTMPNTPCLVRSGMTGIAPGRYAKQEHIDLARKIFDTLGRSVVLDEKHLDAVTGLSGSGPAFMYMVVEALAEGGVKVGLPRETATLLAAQTMLGSSKMILETQSHPALLKDAVTTPAGCTIDGILELEEGGLRVTLIKAVVKAAQRASELFKSDARG